MNTATFESTDKVLGFKPETPEAVRVRYCLSRVRAQSRTSNKLSIDSQIKEMSALAARDGLDVVEVKRESHSAKETGQRQVFNEILDEIRAEKCNSILTWTADRIRASIAIVGIWWLMKDEGWRLVDSRFHCIYSHYARVPFRVL